MMERLTIDEVIEHCKRQTEKYEQFVFKGARNFGRTELTKQYLEHKQVAEWLEELKKYRDLEEQGMLLKLPCKVGDIVHFLKTLNDGNNTIIIEEFKIHMFSFTNAGLFLINHFRHSLCVDLLGKTVFLTKEEAEAILKELENE